MLYEKVEIEKIVSSLSLLTQYYLGRAEPVGEYLSGELELEELKAKLVSEKNEWPLFEEILNSECVRSHMLLYGAADRSDAFVIRARGIEEANRNLVEHYKKNIKDRILSEKDREEMKRFCRVFYLK